MILIVPQFWLRPQESDIQPDAREFMRKKLVFTQEIVRALALEDYDKLAENAQNLIVMSLESNWNVYQQIEYAEMSRDFRAAAQRLQQAAEQKSLDGATLAYFEVTLGCVRCQKLLRHKLLRQKLQVPESPADREPTPKGG